MTAAIESVGCIFVSKSVETIILKLLQFKFELFFSYI